jgi:hypothetical protein
MHNQQNYYHGHLPAKFTIKDIYANTVLVERIEAGKILEGGVLLNERPVERIFIENDGTIVLMTNPLEYGSSRLITFHFHGSQFWEILHNEARTREDPNPEYAGALEAQLVYIRQISKNGDREMPSTYHTGGMIVESPNA